MLRTAGLLALPRRTLSAGFDDRISPDRRRSATRRLGPYRGQTFTGKPIAASLDTQCFRTPASSSLLGEPDSPAHESHPPPAPQITDDWFASSSREPARARRTR